MAPRQEVSKETAAVFHQLRSDTINLHARWKLFRQLYADEQGDRIALLRDTASNFFYIVQWLFLNDMSLALTRLIDPLRSAGRANLVLEKLVTGVEADAPTDGIGARLRTALESLRVAVEPMRVLRNKAIAHRDLGAAQDPAQNPLPELSRAVIEAALGAVVALLDEFEGWYLGSTTGYRFPVTESDGRWLLQALERARRYERLEDDGKVPVVDIPHLKVGL